MPHGQGEADRHTDSHEHFAVSSIWVTRRHAFSGPLPAVISKQRRNLEDRSTAPTSPSQAAVKMLHTSQVNSARGTNAPGES